MSSFMSECIGWVIILIYINSSRLLNPKSPIARSFYNCKLRQLSLSTRESLHTRGKRRTDWKELKDCGDPRDVRTMKSSQIGTILCPTAPRSSYDHQERNRPRSLKFKHKEKDDLDGDAL